VKSFQTAAQKLQKLDHFKDKNILSAKRNDPAFTVSDVPVGNSLLKTPF
jgi:hypothetical protein